MRNETERERFGGLRFKTLNLPLNRTLLFIVAELSLADISASGRGVYGFHALRQPNCGREVIGSHGAIVAKTDVVASLAADGDLLGAFNIGNDDRRAIG